MNTIPESIPLHYETHLTGDENSEWILFVHGAGGSTRTWRKQMDSFSGKYNLLVVDLINISRVHIVAVSLGSIIGMQMHHSRPHRVSSMVFAGPIVALNTKLRILAKTGLTLAKFIGFQNFYAVTAKLTLPRKNHKKSREIFVRESKFISDFEYKKWTAMYGKTLDDTLQKLFHHNPPISLYMLVGAQDHLFMQPAIDYAKRFANVSIEIIERCGHLVSLEKSEIFNQKCLGFLESLRLV